MNHKRKRPKHQRAGRLLCKPHKDERASKPSEDAAIVAEHLAGVVHPRELVDEDDREWGPSHGLYCPGCGAFYAANCLAGCTIGNPVPPLTHNLIL